MRGGQNTKQAGSYTRGPSCTKSCPVRRHLRTLAEARGLIREGSGACDWAGPVPQSRVFRGSPGGLADVFQAERAVLAVVLLSFHMATLAFLFPCLTSFPQRPCPLLMSPLIWSLGTLHDHLV